MTVGQWWSNESSNKGESGMFQNDLSGLYRNCVPVAGNTWGSLGYLNQIPYVTNQFGLGLNQVPCTIGHQGFGAQAPYGIGQNFGYFGNVPVGHTWSNINTGVPFTTAFNQGTMPVNVFGYYGQNPFLGAQWTTPTGFFCR
jgi:hypothetical protein